MLPRYQRNLKALSEADVGFLRTRTVAVVGCGGLGGYVIEYLCRLGIGSLIVADGDCFEETNLNRQLLALETNRGESKAKEAEKRAHLVNPEVRFTALPVRIDAENGSELLRGADLIMDAVDNIPARFVLQETAEILGVPLMHGAVAGWYGQVSTIFPGDRTFDDIYGKPAAGAEKERSFDAVLGNMSFGPAMVAAFETSEAVKVLLGRGKGLRRKLLVINLLDNDFEVINLNKEGNA